MLTTKEISFARYSFQIGCNWVLPPSWMALSFPDLKPILRSLFNFFSFIHVYPTVPTNYRVRGLE